MAKLKLKGTEELKLLLLDAREEIIERSRPIKEHQAKLALRAALRKAPQSTGALKASAYQREAAMTRRKWRTEIGFDAPYAAYAEEMTLAAKANKHGKTVQRRRRFLAKAIRARKRPLQRKMLELLRAMFVERGGKLEK